MPRPQYHINSSPWRLDADFCPISCGECSRFFVEGDTYYDPVDETGTLINEDAAYCSRSCAEQAGNAWAASRDWDEEEEPESEPPCNCGDCRRARGEFSTDTQEEMTED